FKIQNQNVTALAPDHFFCPVRIGFQRDLKLFSECGSEQERKLRVLRIEKETNHLFSAKNVLYAAHTHPSTERSAPRRRIIPDALFPRRRSVLAEGCIGKQDSECACRAAHEFDTVVRCRTQYA